MSVARPLKSPARLAKQPDHASYIEYPHYMPVRIGWGLFFPAYVWIKTFKRIKLR